MNLFRQTKLRSATGMMLIVLIGALTMNTAVGGTCGGPKMTIAPHHFHLVGIEPISQRPFVLPIEVYGELSWLIGPMGSGKTTAIVQLMERLVFLGYSVVYVDLKGGSMEVHEALRLAAEKRGVRMKRFSIDVRQNATHGMGLFAMEFWSRLTPRQKAQFLLAATGVEHDLASFGKGFFTTANAEVLSYVFENHEPIQNLAHCAERLCHVMQVRPNVIPDDLLRHAGHIVGAIHRLAELDALNVTEGAATPQVFQQRIDFSGPFKRQEIHFYHLPFGVGSGLAAELARMLCRGLTTAAALLPRRHQTFIALDEFSVMQSHALNHFISQSRSLDIGVILANQTVGQIQDQTVLSNLTDGTRFRQWFGFGLEIQPWFESRSGKRIDYLESRTLSDGGVASNMSVNLSEQVVPHLSINDLKAVTSDPALSVVEVARDGGPIVTRGIPRVVRTQFTCSKAEYERRKRALWPSEPGTFIQSRHDNPPPADDTPRRPDAY